MTSTDLGAAPAGTPDPAVQGSVVPRVGRPSQVPDRPPTTAAVARHATRLLAVALVAVDVLLLVANLAHLALDDPDEGHHPVFSRALWNGARDGSAVELWGHIQLVLAVVGLGALVVRRRAVVHAAWAVVLVALVADDLLGLHETFAAWLVGTVQVPAAAGLRPQDLGELAAWAIAGAVLAAPLLLAHRRARGADRRFSWTLGGCLLALAAFAVVVDMLHVVIHPHVVPAVDTGMALLETTGELGAMTALLVVVYGTAVRPDPA